MYWLIAGLVIFFGVHIFSDFRSAREKVTQRLGEKRYKAGYSLLAVAGFILIVIGVSKAEPVSLWEPAEWGRYAAVWFMPFAFILLAAAGVLGRVVGCGASPFGRCCTCLPTAILPASFSSVPSACTRFMRCPRR